MVSPVKVGEEYDVTIETVGSKGDGVAKIKGYVVFVKNVSEGDNLKIRIIKTLDKVGFGEIVKENAETKELPELPAKKEAQATQPAPEPAAKEDSDDDEPPAQIADGSLGESDSEDGENETGSDEEIPDA